MTAPVAPTEPGERIGAIDGLRGFALIGILLMNILAMGGPLEPTRPFGPPDLASGDWQVWIASKLLVEGAMRGLFSMLFGAGMLLFLREGRAGGEGRRWPFLRRSAWLVLFGAINGTLLLWPGDILLIYGLAAFALLPFARLAPRRLMGIGLAAVVAVSAFSVLTNLPSMPGEILTPTAPAWLAERAARLGSYGDTLVWMTTITVDWTFDPSVLWWVLEAWSFMLIGMALLKLGVLDGRAEIRVYGLLAALGFGLALPLNAAETWAIWNNTGGELPWTAFTDQFGRLALTLGWLGLFQLAWRTPPVRAVLTPLSSLGRMALTGYLGQSLIAAVLFSGFGLGLWGQLSWPQMWLLVIPIMAAETLFATLWLRAFRFGPMEWLWRSLTYGRPQPMRRG